MHALGPEATVEIVFGGATEGGEHSGRVDRIERRVDKLLELVERLQAASDAQREILDTLVRGEAVDVDQATPSAETSGEPQTA